MMDNLEYFLDKLFQPSATEIFGVSDLLLAMTVSALLCFVLASVYRHTHRGTSYSQSFIVTLFLMAVATSVVMMIIGSNIARAFSLVGALSIIRFRTAVKDARDTGYLFAAMIAGMGCGTGFYLASITLTTFLAALMLILYATDYGIKSKLESIVRVTYRTDDSVLARIEQEIGQSFREFRLINRVLDFGDDRETNVYVVRPRSSSGSGEIEKRLRTIDGVVSLSIYQSDQHAPF
ncbi:MAG: DUF4956 domain-containing protein [Candidatus Rokubacteria bacterium]|nr:DUF4956 domain-containing protein [Candidatus Rokubacteria bacterium]